MEHPREQGEIGPVSLLLYNQTHNLVWRQNGQKSLCTASPLDAHRVGHGELWNGGSCLFFGPQTVLFSHAVPLLFCFFNNNNCIQRCSSRFFTISSLCWELSPTHTLKWPKHNRVQITCNTLSTYHVQRVVCRLVRMDSSDIKFDRVEMSCILALLYWVKPLTDEEGEETGAPGENPWRRASAPVNSFLSFQPIHLYIFQKFYQALVLPVWRIG